METIFMGAYFMGAEFSEACAPIISKEIIICPEESSKVSFAASQPKKPTRVNKIADSVKNCPSGLLSLKTREWSGRILRTFVKAAIAVARSEIGKNQRSGR